MRVCLSELKTVRVVCTNKTGENICGVVTEISLEQFGKNRPAKCPACTNEFKIWPAGSSGVGQDAFEPFATAVTNLLRSNNTFKIYFDLPICDKSATQS